MRIMQQAIFAMFVASLVLVPPSAAQDQSASATLAAGQTEIAAAEPDARWLPWLGCWQLWEEQLERADGDGSQFPDRTVVCMTPAETPDGKGAHLAARGGTKVLVERMLVADGRRRDISDGECLGWEQRTWSKDGYRLYTNAELRCGENTPVRQTSGISFLSGRATWVDLQLVTVSERQHMEIRRYTPASSGNGSDDDALGASRDTIRQARVRAGTAVTLPGIRDAAQSVDPRVVEAMLTETEPRLHLDAAALIELDDAGINGSVIDLLVALAHPERFTVQRRSSGGGGFGSWASGGGGFGNWSGGGGYDPIWYSDLYPYYLAPMGYGAWGRGYNPYFYNYGTNPFIDTRNTITGLGETPAAPSAVKGVGYTQVRERGAVERAAPRAGSGGGGSGSGVSNRTGGSSGGGSVSTGGYTRGGGGAGGGGGGGRTAVPRR